MSRSEESVDFGFQRTTPLEKTQQVQDIFHRVASSYDIMNTLMSLGTHHWWKSVLVKDIPLIAQGHYLDVAGGTGDIAYRLHQKLQKAHTPASVTVFDLNTSMMEEGRKKPLADKLSWACGDAANLPFESHTLDVYTISFGLRNVTHYEKAIQEAYRTLKPGGVYYCLEFSRVDLPLLKQAYDFHSFRLIPYIGGLVAKDKQAYQYLVESIRQFPSQQKMKRLLEQHGFKQVRADRFFGGIATLYKGWKI